MVRGRRWTAEEVEYLKNSYYKVPTAEIAEKLNRSTGAIKQRARKEKITVYKNKKYTDSPNPNPITDTTRRHTCIWHSEGTSIEELSKMFDRPQKVIKEIIETAKSSGKYERYLKDKARSNLKRGVAI